LQDLPSSEAFLVAGQGSHFPSLVTFATVPHDGYTQSLKSLLGFLYSGHNLHLASCVIISLSAHFGLRH